MLMEFMHSQEQNLIASDAVCEVWSPYDAFDAAQTMLEVLTGFQAISLGTSQQRSAEASDMCYKPEPGNE